MHLFKILSAVYVVHSMSTRYCCGLVFLHVLLFGASTLIFYFSLVVVFFFCCCCCCCFSNLLFFAVVVKQHLHYAVVLCLVPVLALWFLLPPFFFCVAFFLFTFFFLDSISLLSFLALAAALFLPLASLSVVVVVVSKRSGSGDTARTHCQLMATMVAETTETVATILALKTPPSSLEDPERRTPVQERGVGVAVRVRPLSTSELANSAIGNCIQCLKDSIVVGGNGSPTAFQTATAKGLGNAKSSLKPRQFQVDTAVRDIFEEKTALEEEEGKAVVIKCSFVEIYNENVFDLLAPPRRPAHARTLSSTAASLDPSSSSNASVELKNAQWVNGRPALPVRDAGKAEGASCNPETLHISGLTYLYPTSVEEFAQAIEMGRANRFVACTAANPQSSRSHAIITIEVHVTGGYDTRGRPCPGTIARIRMCDLAGSERAASSSNSGIRLREGGNINRSLLALGAVVQSLLQRKQHPLTNVFIPYRGSCLTRLLKDSLGGNCRTQMIFCLNPSTQQQEECINTMLFAMKARQIQVAARRHEFNVNSEVVAKSQELLIDELRQKITVYEEELARLGVSHPEKCGGSRLGSRLRCPESRDKSTDPFLLQGDQLHSANNISVLSSSLDAPPDFTDLNSNTKPFLTSLALDTAREPSPAPIKSSLQRRRRTSPSTEVSPQFAELDARLKSLMAEKESQYWMNREAKERLVARDLQLRELKWKLARFLASNELGVRLRGDPATTSGGTVPTPVGVAGMRRTIAAVEAEQEQETSGLETIMMTIDTIDRQIERVRSEVRQEKHQTMFELLFEVMKLRQNCTEAEHLASDYHQECRQAKGRIAEYQEALGACVNALHSVIPHLSHNSSAMAEAKLALFYANLPNAKTPDMIRVFEASLKADSTPPLVPSTCASPSKRHQRSSSGGGGEELLDAIQDLEASFHSLPVHTRHRGFSPLHVPASDPHMALDVGPPMLAAGPNAALEEEPLARSQTTAPATPPPEDHSDEPGAAPAPAPTPTPEPAATVSHAPQPKRPKATPQARRSPEKDADAGKGRSPATLPRQGALAKLPPFTRFYSTNPHVSLPVAVGTTSLRTIITPARRRREGEHAGKPAEGQRTSSSSCSPLRAGKTHDAARRPASASACQSQSQSQSQSQVPPRVRSGLAAARVAPRHGPGALVGESPTKKVSSPATQLLHSGSSHGAALEEGPGRQAKGRLIKTDTSRLFQRSGPSVPHRVKPSTAPPPPSIPGLATAVPPPKTNAVVTAKRVSRPPAKPPSPVAPQSGTPSSACPSVQRVDVSPISARTPTMPHLLDTPPMISMLSVGDEMEISRSSCSELGEFGELYTVVGKIALGARDMGGWLPEDKIKGYQYQSSLWIFTCTSFHPSALYLASAPSKRASVKKEDTAAILFLMPQHQRNKRGDLKKKLFRWNLLSSAGVFIQKEKYIYTIRPTYLFLSSCDGSESERNKQTKTKKEETENCVYNSKEGRGSAAGCLVLTLLSSKRSALHECSGTFVFVIITTPRRPLADGKQWGFCSSCMVFRISLGYLQCLGRVVWAVVTYHTPFPLTGPQKEHAGRVYRIGTKKDCYTFRHFADTCDGFEVQHADKDKCMVWSKHVPGEAMHIIKAIGFYPHSSDSPISCELLYDMLHDPTFRGTWDNFRQEAFQITMLDPRNEIGYYAGKSPVMLVSARDFVNQRLWHPAGRGEYIIFNSSVPHKDVPEDFQDKQRKGKNGSYVRAISKVTGYFVQPWKEEGTGKDLGVTMTYVTQTDLRGSIPTSVTNYLTKKVAPKTLRTIEKAMRDYRKWRDEQMAAGTYKKDWEMPEEWWADGDVVTPEGEPVKSETLDFVHAYWKKK
eukprot:gene4812-3454_t